MLAWRDFLAGGAAVLPEDVNILSYVDLYNSSQDDLDAAS